MKKNKSLLRLVLLINLMTLTCFVFASPRDKYNDINVRVGAAYYLMDGALVSDGYVTCPVL